MEESGQRTATLVEQQAKIAALQKKIVEQRFAGEQAVAVVKKKYKDQIIEIRAEAEQNKIAAQLMDSTSITDKLREMQVPFNLQKLDQFFSRQKEVDALLK